jgi:hypothetical protein
MNTKTRRTSPRQRKRTDGELASQRNFDNSILEVKGYQTDDEIAAEYKRNKISLFQNLQRWGANRVKRWRGKK